MAHAILSHPATIEGDKVKAVSLLYHDVVPEGMPPDHSGFLGKGPGHYKLRSSDFDRHLRCIAQVHQGAVRVTELAASDYLPLLLTFDDGGSSASEVIAPALERLDWPGHFFIATDFINRVGFATIQQIRQLHRKGHVIGSHSASHPLRMSSLSDTQLRSEWRKSISVLQELLGSPVTVASVPGGGFSKKVALVAAETGIKYLFTSEPVMRCYLVEGCLVIGRYSIWSDTTAKNAVQLVGRRLFPILSQYVGWNTKKLLKAAIGDRYLSFRDSILARKSSSQ